MANPSSGLAARLLDSWKSRRRRAARPRACSLQLESLEPRQMLAFTDSGAIFTPTDFGASAWGDYNNNGLLDVFITGHTPSGPVAELWQNNGDGTFTEVFQGEFEGVRYSSVAWGDYNGDGDLDLLYSGANADGTPITRLYRNDGPDGFTLVSGPFENVAKSAVAFADIDGDGKLDIFLTGGRGTNGNFNLVSQFYRNEGDDTFVALGSLNVPAMHYASVDFADFDGDGDLDLLITGTTGSGGNGALTRVYRNDGGTFTDINAGLFGIYRGSAQWADLNGDGDLDIVAAGRSEAFGARILVYENVNGTFNEVLNEQPGGYDAALTVGDFDNDGDLDFLVTLDFTRQTRLYENTGNLTFNRIDPSLDGLVDTGAGSAHFVDFDRDGDLDLFLTGTAPGNAKIAILYENDVANGATPIVNAPPAAPTGLTASENQGVVLLNWTPPTDDITPTAALRYAIRVGTTPGGIDVVAPAAFVGGPNDGLRKDTSLGAWTAAGAALQGLTPGQTYYWSVQAIDGGLAGSPFATEGSFVYDGQPPTLESFTRFSPASEVTTATTLVFRATFDEAVFNVDPSDFLVTGGSTATVTSVTSADSGAGLLWNVTVSGGDLASFEGTIGLELAAGQNIVDAAQFPLPDDQPAVSQTYTRVNLSPIVVAGPATGESVVRVFNAISGELLAQLQPFPGFTGGVNVAMADFNGDGIDDIIMAAGPGGGPHVRIFDGATLQQIDGPLGSFFAYNPAFRGGVTVAAADINGDGHMDLITGAGPGGGPHVRVFSGFDGSELYSFFAYNPNFRGGVFVAAGDVNADGHADIITGAGAGGGPHVRVFSGETGQQLAGSIGSFFAYDPNFRGGVRVAAGDVNADGHADVITGAGPGGGPHVKALSGLDGSTLASFFAYDPGITGSGTFTGGVFVASFDLNGDGYDDFVTGAGPGGGPHVRVLDAQTLDDLTVAQGYYTVGPDYRFGATVAGGFDLLAGSASALHLLGPTGPGAEALSQAHLFAAADQAAAYWAGLGFDTHGLANVRLTTSDLPGTLLGLAGSDWIVIDTDAAGHGWALTDEDLDAGRVDLLTAVAHEFGHLLGLEDLPGAGSNVMHEVLPPGVRRLDWAAQVERVFSGD